MDKKLNVDEMLDLAKKMLNSEAELHEECLENPNEGVYICEMVMGGRAVMASPDGGMLFADSSTSFEEHLEAFRHGVRTPIYEGEKSNELE